MKFFISFVGIVSCFLFQTDSMAGDQSACVNAWYRSTAKNTCTTKYLYANPNGSCYVDANCKTSNGGINNSKYTGSRGDFERLSNCNGSLKVGSC
jgi:hypothetical protein